MTDPISVIIASIISATAGIVAAFIANAYSTRKIRSELRAGYSSELAKKQIEASEAFWAIFGPTSMTQGEHRIIRDFSNNPTLDVQEARTFISKFQDTFCSKAGLYLSKETRQKLHAFRDILIEHIEAQTSSTTIQLSRQQADKIKSLRTTARLALREEVGTTNLTVANKEFTAYNK